MWGWTKGGQECHTPLTTYSICSYITITGIIEGDTFQLLCYDISDNNNNNKSEWEMYILIIITIL